MGHRGGLAYVRFHMRHRGICPGAETHPECSLGYIRSPLDHHSVADERAPFLVGFAVSAYAVGVQDFGGEVVVVLGQHLPEGLPPVEEEALALLGAAYGRAGEGRQPGPEGVPPAGGELLLHVQGPGPLAGLVTVYVQVAYAAGAEIAPERFAVQSEVVVPIPADGVGVELVHFQAGGFRRRRAVHVAYQGVGEAVDGPFSLGGGPVQDPVLVGRGDLHCPGSSGITRALLHRHHAYLLQVVPDNAVLLGGRIVDVRDYHRLLRQRQFPAEMSLHRDAAPHHLLLGVVLAYPGASGKAPAGGAGDSHLEVQRVGEVHGIAQGVLPTFAHKRQLLLHDDVGGVAAVEEEEAGKADVVHPLQVLPDAVLGDVPVHPVPEDHRPRFVGRVGEL